MYVCDCVCVSGSSKRWPLLCQAILQSVKGQSIHLPCPALPARSTRSVLWFSELEVLPEAIAKLAADCCKPSAHPSYRPRLMVCPGWEDGDVQSLNRTLGKPEKAEGHTLLFPERDKELGVKERECH